MKKIKKFFKKANKIKLCNFTLVFSLIFVVALNFVVQFRVEALQDRVADMQSEIAIYKEQIALLDVEWAYLTRPARLRDLSLKYLQDNEYSVASQIKTGAEIEKYYVASAENEISQVAGNF